MNITVNITDGPLSAATDNFSCNDAGALIIFEGCVRPSEKDQPISALEYEAYEPMASEMLRKIGKEMILKHGLLAMDVQHSKGTVGAGEVSFRLRIAAAHRKEGIAAMQEFIDWMKKDVPIWKKPVYA
ncbi:MAG TPA: molybdenum cofactor biosynthesis protein MoaE [Phycisphaeraceae bacterium]|nr:molybdenum cofactor biosynthesis protein MoaE [Phycisphaeraceae bacterium]